MRPVWTAGAGTGRDGRRGVMASLLVMVSLLVRALLLEFGSEALVA